MNNIDDLLNKLKEFKYAAIYNIFSQQALHEYFKFQHQNGGAPYNLPGVLMINNELKSLEDFKIEMDEIGENELLQTKRNANIFITRNLLKETFRITESHCTETSQHDKMKQEPWYEFARIHVNALSHDFTFKFNKKDKKALKNDIIYNGITLSKSMDGKRNEMSLQIAYILVEDILSFVKTKLQ